MLTQYVHPRLGLPKFLTFEPFFVSALEAYDRGEDTKFQITGGLSPSTIAARMRDSLHGYRINNRAWDPKVDPRFVELFNKHDGTFVIAGPDTNGEVWFRRRHKTPLFKGTVFSEIEGNLPKYMSTKTVSATSMAQSAAPSAMRAKDCSVDTVKAFVNLKSLGQLDQPVIFPGPIDPGLTDSLSAGVDIAFHFDPQRNETILV